MAEAKSRRETAPTVRARPRTKADVPDADPDSGDRPTTLTETDPAPPVAPEPITEFVAPKPPPIVATARWAR